MNLHKRILILLLTACCIQEVARSQSNLQPPTLFPDFTARFQDFMDRAWDRTAHFPVFTVRSQDRTAHPLISPTDSPIPIPDRNNPMPSIPHWTSPLNNPIPPTPGQSADRFPARPRWQQQVDYLIDVSLNEEEHSLDGFVKMSYHNNSPDTLSFIWMHCWPNAYKNDRTAFSEQLLDDGRTDFYFSDKGQRGYINHLDFRVEGAVAKMEDHPQYIDIIKIILPHSLLPGAQVTITTPFHEQLPFPFSGSGYNKGVYQVTQWIPQPAVYDQKGWFPMPYLEQGGNYSEYGDFDVRITLPKNYIVAATGVLASTGAIPTSSSNTPFSSSGIPSSPFDTFPSSAPGALSTSGNPSSASTRATNLVPGTSRTSPAHPSSHASTSATSRASAASASPPPETQTLRFRQKNIPGFAWFANPHFQTDHDTLQLPSGRIIDVYAYYTPEASALWQNSITYIKKTVRFRSALIGEYPYDIISIAEIRASTSGMSSPGSSSGRTAFPGMPTAGSSSPETSYPTLAGINTPATGKALDLAIQHAIGLNWFHTILGPNERAAPWMIEGFNTYYDHRYKNKYYPPGSADPRPFRLPKKVPTARSHITSPGTAGSRNANARSRKPHSPSSPQPSGTHPLASPPTASGSGTPAPASRHRHAPAPPNWIRRKLPADPALLLINTLAAERRDQPISTPSEDFTAVNYNLIAGSKTAAWLRQLEDSLGAPLFDAGMQEYFRRWSFAHPGPEDFRAAMENTSSRNLAAPFARLDEKGPVSSSSHLKKIRPAFLFSLHNTDKINYINIGPLAGYNTYDHFMIGALIHNFNLPPNAFQFLLAPVYATNSHRLNGAGYLGYSWFPRDHFQKITLGLEGAKFSSLSGSDSNGHSLFGGFYKIAPSLRLILKDHSARGATQQWVEWKTYLIGEAALTDYVQKSTDSLSYPGAVGQYHFRYLNQLSYHIENNRVLYPYKALLQIQQGDRFYRINFTGNYFFNYAAGGGLDLRFFAAKFGYLGGKTSSLDLSNYQPKLTGVSGAEDYTYSNYFVGRNDYTGFASQQIMIRDGGLKIRVPNFPWLEGRSDNWVSALNLSSTLPATLVPRWFPLKLFLDIGTYAGAWQTAPLTSRFLYTGGLQLSLFHNILNFYAPLVYSSDFSDQLKTIPDQNTFWKKLSFSIDLQNIKWRQGSMPSLF